MLQFGVRCLELYSCRKKVLRGAEADAVFVIPNDIEIRETYMIGGRKPTPAVPLSQAPLLIATVLEKTALDAWRSAELKLGEALPGMRHSSSPAPCASSASVCGARGRSARQQPGHRRGW